MSDEEINDVILACPHCGGKFKLVFPLKKMQDDEKKQDDE